MRLITFLGTGDYKETTYEYQGRKVQTKLFPVALAEFIPPTEVLAVVTGAAKTKWLGPLSDELGKVGITTLPIDIPDGHSVDDLWKIFDSITEHLNEGESVLFDITHSFRTLPFLSFLAASYLRVAKNIKLEGVFYGAWEARQNDVSPVFDLTPFMSLLDWTTATDTFNKTGNAFSLSSLLAARHKEIWTAEAISENRVKPKGLKPMAETLKQLSQALALPRTKEITKHVQVLGSQLEGNSKDVETWAKPFFVLLERTNQEYAKFQTPDLKTERVLVQWYVEHGQVLQALTLAREWVISWLGVQLGLPSMEEREEVENILNQVVVEEAGNNWTGRSSPHTNLVKNLPNYEHLHKTWSWLRDIRNDAAHCGNNKQPRSAANLYRSINELSSKLQEFFVTE
ncbi:MAG: TIGR02221 family CRISPR-associated protein [Blastocatellia bacterium]|nr:TIGR02221 family CRISPR-associated protein [Blastocatellia bacterium]